MAELLPEKTLSVVELSRALAAAVDGAFPDEFWVRGQIRNLGRHTSGNVFFSLVEPAASGEATAAQVRVTLFASDRERVNHHLLRHGSVRMEDGMEVRIRGRLGHHIATGSTRLRMTWIDPAYTLGRLDAQRDRLLGALAREGLLERNRSLPVPPVPLRVALVTSRGSAATADFLGELRSSGYAWRVFEADARVQGPAAPDSIVRALVAAADRKVDVIALVRGGGPRTDLAPFDTEAVARAIAACPVPVFTGIGHETDRSVADRVAHSSFKTPTACAAALVDTVAGFVDAMEGLGEALTAGAFDTLGRETVRLTSGVHRLARSAPAALLRQEVRLQRHRERTGSTVHRLNRETQALRAAAGRLRRNPVRFLERRSESIAATEARIRALDPAHVLARGWSITRDATGGLVRSVAGVGVGDLVFTTVSDGVVVGRVEDTQEVGS